MGKKTRKVSTAMIKSLKCNCTREWGYCQRQRGISRSEAGGRGWGNDCMHRLQVLQLQGGRKPVRATLKANNTQVQRIAQGLSKKCWVPAADKAYHLLFTDLVGILCEENTWELLYPLKLKPYFSFFTVPRWALSYRSNFGARLWISCISIDHKHLNFSGLFFPTRCRE